ncbi:CD59 glycoprotein [Amia ocellicauda]|uniref:CD59 glycoprotein n=1 Tax=Amia ocellicauda TaxID=2972642 RepID=UPI0034640B82
MKKPVLMLVLCAALLGLGSALKCYKCSDDSGCCANTEYCTYEDACLTLSEKDGRTIRQCIRFSDCVNTKLHQMFPAISGFTFKCCFSNLCNRSPQP